MSQSRNPEERLSGFPIAQKTVEKIFPEGIGDPVKENKRDPKISLEAARTAGIEQPFGEERAALHEFLVVSGSDFITCLSAWALFLDLKSHADLRR